MKMGQEQSRWQEQSRRCVIVPGATITLANSFRRNISASEFVLPEHFRGGTNPLSHLPDLECAASLVYFAREPATFIHLPPVSRKHFYLQPYE